MRNELPSKDGTTKKVKPKINKPLLWVAVGATFASAFFIAGIRYERSHTPVRLPANQTCIAYADSIDEALKTFPNVDSQKIENLSQECRREMSNYQVTLKGQK